MMTRGRYSLLKAAEETAKKLTRLDNKDGQVTRLTAFTSPHMP